MLINIRSAAVWSGLWNAFPKLWGKSHKTHIPFCKILYSETAEIINEWPETPWIWMVIASKHRLFSVLFVLSNTYEWYLFYDYDYMTIGTRLWYRFVLAKPNPKIKNANNTMWAHEQATKRWRRISFIDLVSFFLHLREQF